MGTRRWLLDKMGDRKWFAAIRILLLKQAGSCPVSFGLDKPRTRPQFIGIEYNETQENKRLNQTNPDRIVASFTISQVSTDAVSPVDEAELARIWKHGAELRHISFKGRATIDGSRESESVISARTLL
jgi:hypothetical protein